MTTELEAVADWLGVSAPGTRLWVRGLGRSMWPLLDSGDAIEVERCDASRLRRGDIALMRVSPQTLTAHLVTAVSPLRTASFLGRADLLSEGSAVLGRAVTLERSRRRVSIRHLRRMIWAMHRGAMLLRWVKHRAQGTLGNT
jgi:mycothiol synthase